MDAERIKSRRLGWCRSALACAAFGVAPASVACARQVCECAVLVGGTTPANADEQAARGRAVDECLAKHGGGTIHGCPMPASMPPVPMTMPQPAPPPPAPTLLAPSSDAGAERPDPPATIAPPPVEDSDASASATSDPVTSSSPRCPARPPTSAASCPLGVGRCAYARSSCVCIDECRGGAKIPEGHVPPPPRWECSPRPPKVRADGCPGEPPAAGSRCSGAKRCAYGLAETGVCWGFTLACANHTWTPVWQAPPP